MKYIIVLLGCFVFFSSQALASTCSQSGTVIIYTNGVLTGYVEAGIALEKLRVIVGANIDSSMDEPILAYNYHQTFAKDVLEAAVQRLPQVTFPQ